MAPDFRYRDMCVTGAPLPQNTFDKTTSEINAPDITGEWSGASSSSGSSPEASSSPGASSSSEASSDASPGAPSPGTSPGSSSSSESEPDNLFSQKYVGKVLGAKPPIRTCMPLRDTPRVNVDPNQFVNKPNLAFTYFMNINDRSFVDNPVMEKPYNGQDPNDIWSMGGIYSKTYDAYGKSNFYLKKTFFIGNDENDTMKAKEQNCPDFITLPKDTSGQQVSFPQTPDSIADRAALQRFRAEKCYDYYILNHALKPWFTMERPAGGTDDPLSLFSPDRTFLNNCQPLVNGEDAEVIQYRQWYPEPNMSASKWEKQSGFAPVNQHPYRPDMDEAEYLLSTYLQKTWDANFDPPKKEAPWWDTAWGKQLPPGHYTTTIPSYKLEQTFEKQFPPIALPCVQDPCTQNPSLPGCGDTAPPPAHNKCPVSGGDGPCPTPAYLFQIPSDRNYSSPAAPQYYCPNVEKITEPGHPFSPRHDMSGMTDRDYSARTSQLVPFPTVCDTRKRLGYTDYNATTNWVDDDGEQHDAKHPEPGYQVRNPVVQCAVVPVDILSFRKASFDNCIMQRINYNFQDWILHGQPDMREDIPGQTWTPPCKTRFFEYDTVDECPVRMSIQQCCRIIVKDVVPANFLKLRTCEGLMEKRRNNDQIQEDVRKTIDQMAAMRGFPELPPDPNPSDVDEDNPAIRVAYLLGDNDASMQRGYYPSANAYNVGALSAELENHLVTNATMQLNRQICGDNVYSEPKEYRFGDQYFSKFTLPAEYVPPDTPPCADGSPAPCEGDPLYDYKRGGFVGHHMPYMRWWDTGASSGQFHHGGSFVNTLGGFDTLIGVGREERDPEDAKRMKAKIEAWNDDNDPATDEGGDPLARLPMKQSAQMGRVGGWEELKAHEMWSIRRSNLFCLGRYEKLFKPGGPEDLVLAKAGSGYTSVAQKPWPWSLGWRGYITDSHQSEPYYQFPHFPRGAMPGSILNGLDLALEGDIIGFTINGLPQIAYVKGVDGWALPNGAPIAEDAEKFFDYDLGRYKLGNTNGQLLHPTRLFVVSWDQGKFPTSTGSSISWGMGPERTIYRNEVPSNYRDEICRFQLRALTDPEPSQRNCRDGFQQGQCSTYNCQPSCEDPDYSACVLPDSSNDWNQAKIYRPYFDVRKCTGAISYPSTTPAGQQMFDLEATYNWTLWTGDPFDLRRPDADVIYQSKSYMVNSDLWGYCVNAGYDPPPHWSKNYSGAQTGAITDTTLCGPEWGRMPVDPDSSGSSSESMGSSPEEDSEHQPGCATRSTNTQLFPKQ